MTSPLVRDRDVEFLLYDVLDAPSLTLQYFADHGRDKFDPLPVASARRLAC